VLSFNSEEAEAWAASEKIPASGSIPSFPIQRCVVPSPVVSATNLTQKLNISERGIDLAADNRTSVLFSKSTGGYVMKQLLTLTVVTLAIALLVAPPFAYSQQPQQDRQTAEKTFDGQLMKVDAATKSISLRDENNKEMTFRYSDQTVIVGAENNIQGLTGKTGTPLKVSYREDRGANMATRIEVLQK
jgi:hypothetical protein